MTRDCPICLSQSALPLFLNELAPLDGLDMSYRVARCTYCGFDFADHLPDAATFAAYYRTLSKYDVDAGSAELSIADSLRCNAVVSLLRHRTASNAAIVDLGCGSGMLLAALRAGGWTRLTGIDPAPGAPQRARQTFGLDSVQCGTLDRARELVDLAATDVVCLTGVLEHLPRLREDIVELTEAVGPQTMILIEVPAAEKFSKPPFEPFGEFSLEHIQYFSGRSLQSLFAAVGFRVEATEFVALPSGYCDSLFGLFTRDVTGPVPPARDAGLDDLHDYIARSEHAMQSVLARIAACPSRQLVIYGGGSHTARLLPRLLAAGETRLAGLVDNNINLHGKYLGPLQIQPPNALGQHPEATILISSFRSQAAIEATLRAAYPNPLLTLY